MTLMQAAMADPGVVLSPLDHLYVPKGFDSNDSVEVVVTGSFPNPCYSRNKVEVKLDQEIIDITVTALEHDRSNKSTDACPEMIVPFKEVVTIGNLQGGDYQVVVNRADTLHALKDGLKVDEASSSSVDENVYAAVEWVEKKSKGEYILHATQYSPCYKLDKIEVVSNHKDTLSILPVMKQVSTFCPMKGVPVTFPIALDFKDIKVKKPLLHVRTLDGKSVNTIVDLEGRK